MNYELIILASGSPRRRELLAEAGVPFEVHAYETDERRRTGEQAEELVQRLSLQKAKAAESHHFGRVILGADTVVVFEGKIFGKPKDVEAAKEFLRTLSGQTHEVLTGVTLVNKQGMADTWLSRTSVTFKTLTEETIATYVSMVNTLDKAGAYAIQEHGDMLVEQINGLMSNVIGLPVEEVVERLKAMEK